MSQLQRRRVLAGAAALPALLASGRLPAAAATPAAIPSIRVKGDRLRSTLEALSLHGRKLGGSFSDGVSRYGYSDADIAGRGYVMKLLRLAGCEPDIDAAGNIMATRPGRGERGLKPIMIGSHIDSVPGGGNFDGALGAMAAIEVLQSLEDARLQLRHPLQVAIWSNEEGGTIGSGLAVGAVKPETLQRVSNGVRIADGIRRIGGDPDKLASARIVPGSIAAYVELHIEQSGLLEKAGVPIGVVDGIVSIDEYTVEIRGFANHAGTTPMPDRRNAVLAAAKFIEAVQEEVTRLPGRQVGTVGHMEVTPNARNVVPGRVVLSLELRDLDAAVIREVAERIAARAALIAEDTGTTIAMTSIEHDAPTLAAPAVQRVIEQAAASLGLATLHLPSGAGHDAANLASIGPMGMIFVPSVLGISHSPNELTRWPDCAHGADVLLQTVLRLDRA
jgi:beta-ureidopropionase / N-carbamoyl-L-amino-acid hydrolase